MQATRSKPLQPVVAPGVRREQAAKTELRTTPVRPTVTVWIGDTSYQAILV